jgi:hypothetical protein
MMRGTLWRGLLVSAVVAAAGCSGAPQTLVAQGYVGKRVVRYSLEPARASEEEAGRLFNLKVTICNHGKDGLETDCTETVVLENVLPTSE